MLNFKHDISLFYQNENIFKTSHELEFKNLDDSVLSSDFSDLKTSAASMTSTASATSVASMTFTALPSKIQIFTNIWTLSVRGSWGQSMVLFSKLVDETQWSKPHKPSRLHKSIKLLIFLPLRVIYFRSNHYETPCKCTCKFCPIYNFSPAGLMWVEIARQKQDGLKCTATKVTTDFKRNLKNLKLF